MICFLRNTHDPVTGQYRFRDHPRGNAAPADWVLHLLSPEEPRGFDQIMDYVRTYANDYNEKPEKPEDVALALIRLANRDLVRITWLPGVSHGPSR